MDSRQYLHCRFVSNHYEAVGKEQAGGYGIKFFLASGKTDAANAEKSRIPAELRELAVFDSVCEKYGITLRQVCDNYSMAQIALISHISFLRYEDDEARRKSEERSGGRKKHFLNTNNAEAAALIMSGMCS